MFTIPLNNCMASILTFKMRSYTCNVNTLGAVFRPNKTLPFLPLQPVISLSTGSFKIALNWLIPAFLKPFCFANP